MISRRGLIIGSSALVAAPALARPVTIPINGLFPQTKAIIAAFTTPPTSARIAAINGCVGLLIRGGVWGLIDVLYVTAAADAQAKTINWKNPGLFTLSQIGSVAFVPDRGVTSDGTTGYFDTGYPPSTAGGVYAQDSGHLGVWITSNVASGGQDVAINPGSFTVVSQINSRNTSNFLRGAINDATAVSNSANTITDSTGHSVLSRVGFNVTNGYKNGSSTGTTDATASTGVAQGNMFVCGNPTSLLSPRQIGAVHIGAGLVSMPVAVIDAALFSYMHAVGAA